MMKSRKIMVLITMVLVLLYYYNVYKVSNMAKKGKYSSLQKTKNGDDTNLINTTGCVIPNYGKTMKFYETEKSNVTCGRRVIFVTKLSQHKLKVTINAEELKQYYKASISNCYYSFAARSRKPGKQDTTLRYTKHKFLGSKSTTIPFITEVLRVKCTSRKNKVLYKDHYVIVKKRETLSVNTTQSFNVLIIGIDTMSRARMMFNLPKTVEYLQGNGWIDYKGYQKVGFNTFPNVMSLLTGKNVSMIYKECGKMDYCNHHMMWTKFRQSDYITAYGEDYLFLPDTFSPYHGFTNPPTDHYMKPFFLLGEQESGNDICCGKTSSVMHLLNYAQEFAETYQNEKTFGFFWLNSFGHNQGQRPSSHDIELVEFMENLNKSRILDFTFVLLLSDHGVRFGPTRFSMEAYYEERLPMLYIWVPASFRNKYKAFYNNLLLNQDLLTTPYDVHMTLLHILSISNNSVSNSSEQSEGCPKCRSLFEKHLETKNCFDAGVDEKWCSCHSMTVPTNSTELEASINTAVATIEYLVQSVKTKKCTVCHPLRLTNIIRSHMYQSGDFNYYVIAFEMSPGNYPYEVTVRTNGIEFKTLAPTHTIKTFPPYGDCVLREYDKSYCYCTASKDCMQANETKNIL